MPNLQRFLGIGLAATLGSACSASNDASKAAVASERGKPSSNGPAGGAGPAPIDPSEGLEEGMELFILFGQSNMAGSAPIEDQDREQDPRIKVLGMYDCAATGRVYNEWATAAPPLHGCGGSLGPADTFSRAVAAAWPNSEIGLVPNAVPGVEIDFFRKGMTSNQDQDYKRLPNGYASAYEMMLDRSRLALASGRIRGILFHQGESDSGQAVWVEKVAEIVADLRADLELGVDVPFLAGELPHTGCCAGHNTFVQELPGVIPNTVVVSARGLDVFDDAHFDSQSVRTFGQRYAEAFLELVPSP